MNRFVERYCAQVSKRLVASRRTRRRLLEGLTGEILERLGGKCSEEDIVLSFGSPEAVAAELQGCVPAEETGSTRSGWLNRHMILAAICIILAASVIVMIAFNRSEKVIAADSLVEEYVEHKELKNEETDSLFYFGNSYAVDGSAGICRWASSIKL